MTGRADFWARRRAAVEAEAQAEAAALEAKAREEDHAALETMSEEEMLVALDLPDPDTLQQGDDFTVFMSKAVPDQLRRRALRTLWRSNPVLANVDMLVDYGEDFTDAALAVENLQTAYQVGKGMLKHVEEMARQAAEHEAPSEVEETPDAPEIEMVEEPAPEPPQETIEMAQASETPEEVMETSPAPRRMKFRIEDAA